MPAPATVDEFLDLVRKSGVLETKRLDPHITKLRSTGTFPKEPGKLAGVLVRDGLLTQFQAEQLMMGKWRRFTIGKYKVLERLGSGGMGSVYLCEHKLMRRRVAVKVLPTAKAKDPSSLERFYREARAVAALDHPNIVHAYDIDQDEELHFLVMEFVDGASLQEIVKRSGRLNPLRAAHYMYQAALGLDHAQTKGIVHRDVKPGNLLVDRQGVLKILDMGLARFFNDEEDDLTKKFEENVLGTADYLAPEQAIDSHEADTRADIYSLGATFYFTLTGRTPFGEGTVAQILILHQTRKPEPISSLRSDVPPGFVAILEKMMAKQPEDRYQTPHELSEVLVPWVQKPIGPPTLEEMPRLSPAAVGQSRGDSSQVSPAVRSGGASSSKKNWHITPTPATSRNETPSPKPAATPPSAPPRPPSSSPPRPVIPSRAPSAKSPPPSKPAPPPKQETQAELRNGLPPAPLQPTVNVQEEEAAFWSGFNDQGGTATDFNKNTEAPIPTRPLSIPLSQSFKPLWIGIGIIALLVAVVIVVLVMVFDWGAEPAVETPALKVSQTEPNSYRSITSALRAAKPGDTIELWDEYIEENVIVDPQNSMITQVTLKAAQGKHVIWTFRKGRETRPLLQMTNAQGFKLKGERIVFDGQGQCPKLLLVSYSCSGLSLKDFGVKGFTEYAVGFFNCQGEEKPVLVEGMKVVGEEPKAETIFYFKANPDHRPPFNDLITIEDLDSGLMSRQKAFKRADNWATGNNVQLPAGFEWAPDKIPEIPKNNKKRGKNNKKKNQ